MGKRDGTTSNVHKGGSPLGGSPHKSNTLAGGTRQTLRRLTSSSEGDDPEGDEGQDGSGEEQEQRRAKRPKVEASATTSAPSQEGGTIFETTTQTTSQALGQHVGGGGPWSPAPRVFGGTSDGYSFQRIDVPYSAQRYDEWCWAATLQMIVRATSGANVDQHVFAQIEHQCTSCDGSNEDDECRQGCDDTSVSSLLFTWGINADRVRGLVSFETLEEQIRAGMPILYNITFVTEDGDVDHMGVLSGTRRNGEREEVYILDPDRGFFEEAGWPHERWISYNDLLNGYGLPGNWSDTWVNIRA